MLLLPEPIIRFNFDCLPPLKHLSSVASVNNGSMLGLLKPSDVDHFDCDRSAVGVQLLNSTDRTPIIESNRNVSDLLDHFAEVNSSGVTIELWTTPSEKENFLQFHFEPIVTIGLQHVGYERNKNPEIGCGFDLQIAKSGPHYNVAFADSEFPSNCRQLSIPSEMFSTELSQIVVSFSNRKAKIFINGNAALEVQTRSLFVSGSPIWDSASTLQLFSSYESNGMSDAVPYKGKLHSLSIYDTVLSRHDVDFLFHTGRKQIIQNFFNNSQKLFAAPSDSYTLVQGRTFESSLKIGGENFYIGGISLAVSIISLPSNGRLVTFSYKREVLNVGSLIELEMKENLTPVHYLPSSNNYFNYPNRTANGISTGLELDSFEFILLAFSSETKDLLGASQPATQHIQVMNANHKPILVVPQHVAYDTITSKRRDRPKIKIEGINLVDTDLNVRKVRVDIIARNGTITLNENYRNLADFACGSHYQFGWHCHGNGVGDRSMTFLAVPGDIALILEGVVYESFRKTAIDDISIIIFDGSSGSCPTVSDMDQIGCFKVQAKIRIKGTKIHVEKEPISDSRRRILLFVWGMISVIVVLVCGSCIASRKK